jgi:hypothetical protein
MATPDTTNDQEQKEAEEILAKIGAAEEKEAPKDLPKPSVEDDIEKPIAQRDWKFSADYNIEIGDKAETHHYERTYTQKPLSYHAMLEITGLLGRKLDEAMSGPEGLSVDKIIELLPDEKLPVIFTEGRVRVADNPGLKEIDSLIKSFLKVITYVPDFLIEAQCIWLRIPRNERPLAMDIWSRPVDEGGMSMKDGDEMLSLFIEQNYDEIEYFLIKWWRNVMTATTRARKRNHKED